MRTKFYFKPDYILLLFFILIVATACSKSPATEKIEDEEPEPVAVNPIFQADPSIFYHDNTYYLFGTNDRDADNGFLVYSSSDMENWTPNGHALRKGDAYGTWGFWANQVWEHEGKFYMAYTANEKIAIAEATKPTGPYKQVNKTPIASAYGQIDPFIFIDDDGTKYLYHVRLGGGNRIYVVEMTDDFSAIKPETYQECITATPGTWEHLNSAAGRVAEGPTVIKKDGLYYLFYSANDFRHIDYAVGYAVSDSPKGPWTRNAGNPILSRTIIGESGSGHGDIYQDRDNNLHYVFHTHSTDKTVVPRKTATVKLKSVKGSNGEHVFSIEKETFKFLNLKLTGN